MFVCEEQRLFKILVVVVGVVVVVVGVVASRLVRDEQNKLIGGLTLRAEKRPIEERVFRP